MPEPNISSLDMSRCWDVANMCPLLMNLLYNTFVELLSGCVSARPLMVFYNMYVPGDRVVE